MCFFIKDVYVNHKKNPLNVEPSKILFSWHYECQERGCGQNAYRIIVSSASEKLRQGTGDVWDSGIVESHENVNVSYNGETLENGKRYWWKVIIGDNKGRIAESKQEIFFDTCLMQKDWKAKWIWKSQDVLLNDFAYFRKRIAVKENLESAKIYVSAHNYFELFTNGVKTGGYMSPAHSHPQKSKLYLTYDITNSIVEEDNTIGAIVHYLGGSGQNYVNGLPGFILQGELRYKDGTSEIFGTDETWKCVNYTPYRNHTPFQQNRRISAVESYDASLEPSGWHKASYNDASWDNAVISAINLEKWKVKPQAISEGAVERVIIPETCSVQQEGLQVFDVGRIVTGWPRIKLSGKKGICIRLRYSEDLTEEGKVKHNVCNETSEYYYDEYKMKGETMEMWEPHFSYKAFRYIEITGYPGWINHGDVEVVCAHTELDYTGNFLCSEPLLNDIYNACIQTQKNNVIGQMVDCPHREQAQYLGDADLQAETFGYNFLNPDVLEKVLSDFKDSQKEDGTFPFVFPGNVGHPDFSLKIPEYDLHFCTLLWKIYCFYGDKKLIEEYYSIVKKTNDYYMSTLDPSIGLIPKSAEWHISDWPYPNINQEGAFLTVQNCMIYHNLNLLGKMAANNGQNDESVQYSIQAEMLKTSIARHLYHHEKKVFVDSYGQEAASQGANVIAVQYGLVPEEDKNEVLDYIVSKGLACSTLLSLNLLRVLFENGRQEAAYRLINNTEYPGWGFMMKNGYKTIWEGFNNIESHSHAWNAYPARLLVEYIVGIQNVTPGFKEIVINPYIPEGLHFAEGKVATVSGSVYSRWEKINPNKVSLSMSIPSGITAIFTLPVKSEAYVIYEGNYVIWSEGKYNDVYKEITFNKEDVSGMTLKLQSGNYSFTIVEK